MFKLNNKLTSVLEDNGFNVEVEGDHIHLQQYTPAGEDWHLYIQHESDSCSFVDNFRDYTEDFDVDEEFSNLYGMSGAPDAETLLEDQNWKKDTLETCSTLLRYMKTQIFTLSNTKVTNRIPKKVIGLLNRSDISILTYEELDSYSDVNEKFTRCALSCFNSSETDRFTLFVTFNETYFREDCEWYEKPWYRFDKMFDSAIYEQFGCTMNELIKLYKEDNVQGIAKLKELADNHQTLLSLSEKISALYK